MDVNKVTEVQIDDKIAIDRLKYRLTYLDSKSISSEYYFENITCANVKVLG